MSTAGPARPGPDRSHRYGTGRTVEPQPPPVLALGGPLGSSRWCGVAGDGDDLERLHPSPILRRPGLGRIHQARAGRLVAASGRPDRLAPDREPAGLRSPPRQHRIPTLILCGRHDPQYAPACSEELAAGIRDSQVAWFERSGHFPFIEEADAFWPLVGNFLGAASGRPASPSIFVTHDRSACWERA